MGNSIGADEDITNPSTFSYVPQNKCSSSFPPLQRCNFSGQSVFYASMSVKTNFKEIDKESSIGKEVYISKWHVDEDANANMFRIIPSEGIDIDEDYKGCLKIDTEKKYPHYTIEYLRKIGNIFMNDSGDKYDTKKYLPSALISNFIYNFCYTGEPIFPGQSPKYDGIIYPSVKDQDRCLLNVAFTRKFIDTHVKLKYVAKGVIGEDFMSVKMAHPQEWVFAGNRPAMIDFYATWCRPCKMMSPIVEQLAQQYAGKVDFYKVDIDKEPELAAVFGIQSIPTFLFIPQKGMPSAQMGMMEKGEMEKIIKGLK